MGLTNFTSLLIILCFCGIDKVVCDGNGVIFAKPNSSHTEWGDHFCILYNPLFHSLPEEKSQAKAYDLVNLSQDEGCFSSVIYTNDTNVKGKIVAIARGNRTCTFTEKAMMAKRHGAAGILIISKNKIYPSANQTSDYNTINIIVASIKSADFQDILREGSEVEVMLVAPDSSGFDPCIVVIFLLAMLCIIVGGYWAGVVKTSGLKKPKSKDSGKKSGRSGADDNSDDDEEELDISVPMIIVFFFFVCTFLILLYFFYDYLVYVVIALFCLAGTAGLFACVEPLWSKIPWEARLPANKIPFLKQRPFYRDIILVLLCLGVAVFWGIQRKESYAWVLQDILGVAFCVNMLKTLHLPNLKICVILMVLLFLYDIFFVFITPYFTSNGESVMVKVATGGSSGGSSSGEQIPMVFKVPRLGSSLMNVCNLPYSLLGFGDVIVPGLLVSYNHRFDVRVGTRRIYFIATVIAYAIGLVVTFLALYLMDKGQPALLYLVPFTLVTTFVIGCIRGEAGSLWTGISKQENYKKDDTSSTKVQTGVPVTTARIDDQSSSCSSSSGGSESRLLINK
ncbi:signal peptide peptidase-like 2B [Saccostrea echinata]|uniref:signal peptide peptidase-like 2B n=1 Tax=Saccostrea echinata TaxID=191078 RepID=UPI002A838AC9|nr:signal peptide peptidase-like 2B [Saccostrea echinata]